MVAPGLLGHRVADRGQAARSGDIASSTRAVYFRDPDQNLIEVSTYL
jgi:catechol 2,3-dioxygenase-like lactoylglutathione lyase family enzyme